MPPVSRWKAPRSRGIRLTAFDRRRTILNGRRFALGIFSGKIIYNFGTAERLRTLRCPVFTERAAAGKWLFAVTAPTVKKGLQKRPQAFLKPSYRNEIPLIMAKAKAAAIQIVLPQKGRRITSGRSVLPPRPCGWPSWWRCAPRCGCRRTSPRSRTLPCLPAQPAGRFPAQGRSGWWGSP